MPVKANSYKHGAMKAKESRANTAYADYNTKTHIECLEAYIYFPSRICFQ